ncbi:MAG: glycosyltransferase family 4 protein [Planctomycetota bacterium]
MPTPRRILQVITPSHMSGAEMQLVRLTRRMEARGHAMPVALKRGSAAAPEFRRLGIDVDQRAIGGKLNALAVRTLAAAAREHRADLIQTTLSSASWWAGWLESLGGIRSIGHVQGFTSATWHWRQTHLLAVSGAVRDDLIAQGIDGDKITVLYNALAPEEFVPQRSVADVRSALGADGDTPIVGTFGHLSVKKGYRELFQAMPRVLKQNPRTQFWVIGQGKLRDELQEQARRGGFLRSVRFTGYRRDAADLMHAIDVMALPSHREPCALAYIEAALAAKPIVACRAGGAVESIADGETGLLVPVRHGAAVAEAINTLLSDRPQAAKMGRAGRERAQDVFSWQRFIATLEGVYDRVLGDSQALQAA